MNDPTTTLQTIRDYCDEVLANATPAEPEPASRMVAARVREMVKQVEQERGDNIIYADSK